MSPSESGEPCQGHSDHVKAEPLIQVAERPAQRVECIVGAGCDGGVHEGPAGDETGGQQRHHKTREAWGKPGGFPARIAPYGTR